MSDPPPDNAGPGRPKGPANHSAEEDQHRLPPPPSILSEFFRKHQSTIVGGSAIVAGLGLLVSLLIWSHSTRNAFEQNLTNRIEHLRDDVQEIEDRLRAVGIP